MEDVSHGELRIKGDKAKIVIIHIFNSTSKCLSVFIQQCLMIGKYYIPFVLVWLEMGMGVGFKGTVA
jgi:hypothetical protein